MLGSREGAADDQLFSKMSAFKTKSSLHRASLDLAVGMINPDELKGLREMFESMDTGGNGILETSELKAAFKKQGVKMDKKQLD